MLITVAWGSIPLNTTFTTINKLYKQKAINLSNKYSIKSILNMETEEYTIIKYIDTLYSKWCVYIYPNGDKPSNKGCFMIFLQLINIPKTWKQILLCVAFKCLQTMSSWTNNHEYDINDNNCCWGWPQRILLLSELKELKVSEITIKVSINILKIISKINNEIILQFNHYNSNNFKSKQKII